MHTHTHTHTYVVVRVSAHDLARISSGNTLVVLLFRVYTAKYRGVHSYRLNGTSAHIYNL